ncbi:2-dehydro-3-deoxygalactonokinase [Arsenicicoccus sp. oral taxon 190]|uniref:2-dehydro-3-deoxygalactonokinase n=1 Tax=Arsenicicoccus sp. oral taxon 190 TaxID=1658671 RepID=UPI00067DAAD7|nr:2-dehydro-3-deoxygalactonokinase [Arsenicicoccus sp. oral taxon 190]
MSTAALIGLDWGTTAFRAYLFASDGAVLDQAASCEGINALQRHGREEFAKALDRLVGRWLTDAMDIPILAAGMVGSRQGWLETPYVPAPADLRLIPDRLARAPHARARVLIVPGMVDAGPLPSVMRGEETQLVGVLAEHVWAGADSSRRLVVLPGTHTKWVSLEGPAVVSIATTMTGEIYDLLRSGSILASTMEDADRPYDEVFRAAVHLARDSGVGATSTVFSTRSLGLLERLAPGQQADHLSGLLIGHELLDRERVCGAPEVWTLAGSDELCRRYQLAAAELGWPPAALGAASAQRGLWRIATAAELVNRTPAGGLA